MKPINIKNTFLCLIGIVATLLSSCGEAVDDMLAGSNDSQQVTFSLSAEGPEQSRATAAGLRYVMAIYDESGENVIVPATVFDQSTFSVRLNPGKYTCLFWADYGSENYDATDLKAIAAKVNDAADANAEAFYAKQGITVTSGATVNVTLHRAVAQVILRETATLLKGTMTVGYNKYQNFNVSTGIASNEASVTKTINMPSDVFGSAAEPAEVCSIFILANSEEYLTDFKVKYKDGEEKTISNVPIQANCKTNLNGSFGDTPYLTFSAASEQMFGMDFLGFSLGTEEYFEYAVGNGEWTKFTTTVSDIAFGGTHGDLRLRGKSSQGTATDAGACNITFSDPATPVGCTGDIRMLIDYTDYAHVSTANARFCNLFSFCTSLTQAPALPATTLADECYSYMFSGCTSLTQAPVLPATTLVDECYYKMFSGCTSLTQAPELPATTLATSCYVEMFSGCTSLTQAPVLPATTLARSCYSNMFSGCTSLTQAPALPATTLARSCYANMFSGCTSLTQAPALPATSLATSCYIGMFEGCTSLTLAPELPATTLAGSCYSYMFSYCTSLSSVTMLATNVSAANCLYDWLYNAGTEASTRTLTLANQDIYNTLSTNAVYLPDIWKQGAAGTTVNFE